MSVMPEGEAPRTDPAGSVPATPEVGDGQAETPSDPVKSVPAPAAEAPTPEAEAKPPAPEAEAPTPEAAVESPTPEAAVEPPAPEAEVPTPEAEAEPPAPEAAAEAPAESAVPAVPEAATVVAPDPPLLDPKKGQRVRGKIVKIGEDSVFLDFGGREEGVLDLREIQSAEGETKHAVGDEIEAAVVSLEGGIKLSTVAKKKTGNITALLEAQKSGLAVEGRVTGVNKGGLVVRAMGVRAFCPFSQIDRHFVATPEQFVGKKMQFRVSSADPKGRSVVLSRRALIEEQMQEKAEELRKTIEIGTVLDGVVARLRPFGAFVDLGGVDGLIHVSEVSHGRVHDPAEILQVGQEVRVQVLSIEDLGSKKERISLSRKALEQDPWSDLVAKTNVGDQVDGKVVRIVDFGAFVEIVPGLDGLAHVSSLAEGRVGHPSDIVSVGQEVKAWVTKIDTESRRLSLSLVEPSAETAGPPPRSARPDRERKESREIREYRQKAKRESETGLTSMAEAFQRLRQTSED